MFSIKSCSKINESLVCVNYIIMEAARAVVVGAVGSGDGERRRYGPE